MRSLQRLGQELHAKEKEIGTLRERVRAELEAARRLAADAATDHAKLGVREHEVHAREGQVMDWKERIQADTERRLRVRFFDDVGDLFLL